MSRTYQVISCDGHLEIPPDAWVRRVPDVYRDRAPRLVPLATGGEGWIVEGMPMIHNGQNVAAGRPLKVLGGSYWNDDGTPAAGTGSPSQRLREQDLDGLDAEVLFPPVFISRYIENIADRDAYLAMVRAYNDFLVEDYCAVAPDRLIGNAVIPAGGLDDALSELRRVSGLGFQSVCLGQFPNGTPSPSDEDDRFWEAALELGMPLTAHATLGDRLNPLLVQSATGRFDIGTAMMSRTIPPPVWLITQLVSSGVFDRLPELRLYLAETNAGWMPEVFYMLDDSYQIFRDWYGAQLKMLPSEYAREHLRFGIVRDPIAIQSRNLLPVDDLMWGSDFPHSV
jgi:predicted TIM-barrel fold metal-dependent hydrolase